MSCATTRSTPPTPFPPEYITDMTTNVHVPSMPFFIKEPIERTEGLISESKEFSKHRMKTQISGHVIL